MKKYLIATFALLCTSLNAQKVDTFLIIGHGLLIKEAEKPKIDWLGIFAIFLLGVMAGIVLSMAIKEYVRITTPK
jgi:hypothetical protein